MIISATFEALTASFRNTGISGSLEPLEATAGFSGAQGPVGQILASLESMAGEFSSTGNVDGSFAASFEPLSGSLTVPDTIVASLAAIEAELTGAQGVIGSISGQFERVTLGSSGDSPYAGTLAGSFQYPTASFSGGELVTGTIAASMRPLRGTLSGALGQVGSVSASLLRLRGSFSGDVVASGTLSGAMPRMWAYFSGGPQVDGAALETWAMNTRNNAVTRYPSYPANSFARYNGTYLIAGPDGLFVVDGDLEADAVWRVRTGQIDAKRPGLKRLPEVLLSTRYDGPVTVRVWKDEDTYFDYALPNFRPDVLQQVRAKPGKGLRSRYYKVELFGTGGRFELDSLQMTMPETTRRVG
jgi:hypothetical protein